MGAQFEAVNPAHVDLNILVYVNHDDASHYYDLVETLTGYFHADDGTRHPANLHVTEKLTGTAKRRIDGFLWFESSTGRLAGSVFNEGDEDRKLRLCALLGFNPDKIQR